MQELDRPEIALATIDPPEAMDLDRAMYIQANGDGYRVYDAIADVAAFVRADDPVDLEADRRGGTLYGADSKIPLHPKVLSEGATSLLPDQVRPSLLWAIELDRAGEIAGIDVRRARVRGRAKLDYAGVQQGIDAGRAVSVVAGHWTLAFRARLPIEDWNEQISLLTGMAAARLMVQAKVGLLRTLPELDPRALQRLRITARALGIDWPASMDYPRFIRSLDPCNDRHMAMLTACTSVLRGAGYAAFNGSVPAQPMQSAIAAEYTHATAPLRRLVDRYTGEICVALYAQQPVPDWVLTALPGLPATMQASGHRAHQYEQAVLDLADAAALAAQVGKQFDGTIVEVATDASHGVVLLRELAVEAGVTGSAALPLGANVTVTLVEVDPARG